MNLSSFHFYEIYFAIIEKNISKKREYLSRNGPQELGQLVRN